MAYPVAPVGPPAVSIYPTGSVTPNPTYAGNVIPEIWSGKLLEKFYQSTVLAAISNTAYEGEIKNQGDRVHIRTKPTITINDYVADMSIVVERPSAPKIDLVIDKGKYFATILDDVMETQADINLLGVWSDDAAQQMKIKIDSAVLLAMMGEANATNRGLTAGKLSASVNLGVTGQPLIVHAAMPAAPTAADATVLDAILRMGLCLDENNIPEEGRWVVMPAWAAMKIKQSELRQAYLSGDNVSMLRNGRLGQIDRFTLYVSNLMPRGAVANGGPAADQILAAGETMFYAGHAHGLTFASQVSKVETLRSEHTFGQIMRGLQIYGSKVVDGTALCQTIVTPGAA